jgi:hypothetical protein
VAIRRQRKLAAPRRPLYDGLTSEHIASGPPHQAIRDTQAFERSYYNSDCKKQAWNSHENTYHKPLYFASTECKNRVLEWRRCPSKCHISAFSKGELHELRLPYHRTNVSKSMVEATLPTNLSFKFSVESRWTYAQIGRASRRAVRI